MAQTTEELIELYTGSEAELPKEILCLISEIRECEARGNFREMLLRLGELRRFYEGRPRQQT